MFHSFGMVQSKTSVPVGTSETWRLTRCCTAAKVWRSPFPVILRQIGYRSAAKRCSPSPISERSLWAISFSRDIVGDQNLHMSGPVPKLLRYRLAKQFEKLDHSSAHR